MAYRPDGEGDIPEIPGEGVDETLEIRDADAEWDTEAREEAGGRVARTTLSDLRRQLDEAAERIRQDAALARLRDVGASGTVFGSVKELLAAFDDTENETRWPAIDAALVALLAANHARPGTAVGSLLLRVCIPLLRGIAWKRRSKYRIDDRDELDARCLEGFCLAIVAPTTLRRRRYLIPHVRRLVNRHLDREERRDDRESKARTALAEAFARLLSRAERTRGGRGKSDDVELVLPSGRAKPAPPLAEEIVEAYEWVDRTLPPGFLNPVERELLVRVTGCGERVRPVAKDLGISTDAAYQRMSRLADRLEEFAANYPRPGAAGDAEKEV